MTIGPIEYIVVGFPGNQFNGQIAPALADLIDSDTIRILDLVFISKDAEGDVTAFEYDELEELAAFGDLDGEVGGLIGPDDIAHAAEGLDPNSSAALLIWEDTWADAPRRGDAQLGRRAARGRPHPPRPRRGGLRRARLGRSLNRRLARTRTLPTTRTTGGHDHHAPRTTTSGESGGHDRRRGRHGHPRERPRGAPPGAPRSLAPCRPASRRRRRDAGRAPRRPTATLPHLRVQRGSGATWTSSS